MVLVGSKLPGSCCADSFRCVLFIVSPSHRFQVVMLATHEFVPELTHTQQPPVHAFWGAQRSHLTHHPFSYPSFEITRMLFWSQCQGAVLEARVHHLSSTRCSHHAQQWHPASNTRGCEWGSKTEWILSRRAGEASLRRCVGLARNGAGQRGAPARNPGFCMLARW